MVQVFPSRKSLIRMMGAVFSEMDEDWAGRRWFSDDPIGRAVEGAKVNAPEHAYEGTAGTVKILSQINLAVSGPVLF